MIKRYVVLACLVSSAWGGAVETARAGTVAIAAWSFNSNRITTDGSGNILTADDSPGAHDAMTQTLGTGTISSVPGVFGSAAQFNNANVNGQAQTTNNAWMSFPQLTEIAGPAGGNFSVAAWVKVPAADPTWDDNPIVADWGNAPAGTNRFTYWFQLDNVDSNGNLRPRAQIRNANAPPSPMSIDIIATTLSSSQAGTNGGATTFDDDVWHHLAWTWNKATGEMKFYTDGVLRHTQTTSQPPATRDLLISDSAVGALGAKRDNNRYFRGTMDEVKVFNGALSPEQVLSLKETNVIPEPSTSLMIFSGFYLGLTLTGRRSRRA